jgi:SAM-dependent methyltransferase
LLELLCRYAESERPALVVDVGCGTGLSTRAWSGIAERAIGVEPNRAMLDEAAPADGVEYVEAYAQKTGLDDGCADIVTCSQALHWMEPEPVFAEIGRVLRPGGIFAAYDYDWPPVIDADVDAAFVAFQERRRLACERRGIRRGAESWPKGEHLGRMRASGRFRFCREIVLHSTEDGDATMVGGFARSIGLPVADGSDAGLEAELRLDELEAVARRVLGGRKVPFVFGYRVRVGVR